MLVRSPRLSTAGFGVGSVRLPCIPHWFPSASRLATNVGKGNARDSEQT